MYTSVNSRVWRLSIGVILVFTLFSLTVSAQEPDPEGAGSAEAGAATQVTLDWTVQPPVLTDEQIAQQEYWAAHMNLPGPASAAQAAESIGPTPGTESIEEGEERARSGQPLLPSTAMTYRWTQFGGSIPAVKSNAMGSSAAISGKFGFFTGNWFAARTIDGGLTWSFVDPYADFPEFGYGQISIYDEARDMFLWLRTGAPDENGQNVFNLSVSERRAAGWWSYSWAPVDLDPAWAHQWWDHPHIQLGADYAYITWNIYDWNGTPDTSDDFWVRTIMLRIPLDPLLTNSGFTFWYYWNSEWFTFVPVQGAFHSMYWASNWPSWGETDQLRIWKWQEEDEDASGIVSWIKNVAVWDFTYPGDAHCPLSGSYNWLARADHRLLTGARYSINSPGVDGEPKILGRKVLGWWWNVRENEGAGFPLPYIDGAAFFEDTMEQVLGWRGRPYVWSEIYCFAYPSMTPNKRQDLGAVFNFAKVENAWRPSVAYAIADDYISAPPPWGFYGTAGSKAMPADNVWGPWNTVREFEPTQKVWIVGTHYIPTVGDCVDCAAPLYFSFGRERDSNSYRRWVGK